MSQGNRSSSPSFIAQIVGNQDSNKQASFDTSPFLGVVNTAQSQLAEGIRQKAATASKVGDNIANSLMTGLKLGMDAKAKQAQNCLKNRELAQKQKESEDKQKSDIALSARNKLRSDNAKDPFNPIHQKALEDFDKSDLGLLAMSNPKYTDPAFDKVINDTEEKSIEAYVAPDISTIGQDITNVIRNGAVPTSASAWYDYKTGVKNIFDVDTGKLVKVPLHEDKVKQEEHLAKMATLTPKAEAFILNSIDKSIKDQHALNIADVNAYRAGQQLELNKQNLELEKIKFETNTELRRQENEANELYRSRTINIQEYNAKISALRLKSDLINKNEADPIKNHREITDLITKDPEVAVTGYNKISKSIGVDIFNLGSKNMNKVFNTAKLNDQQREVISTDPRYKDIQKSFMQGLALGETPEETANRLYKDYATPEAKKRNPNMGALTKGFNSIGSDNPSDSFLGMVAFEAYRLNMYRDPAAKGSVHSEAYYGIASKMRGLRDNRDLVKSILLNQ